METVFNFTQLAAAVVNSGVEEIILGADIELEAGIIIPASKSELTFDGLYDGVVHRLSDKDSTLPTDALRVSFASSISLTFKNMNMTGRNNYGMPYIADISGMSDVSVTYSDITYEGPQLVINPRGLTHFNNCDITIDYPPNPSRVQEVGEVCRVEFKGANIIRHYCPPSQSVLYSAFWFRGNAGEAFFKVLPGASVSIKTTNYFMNARNLIQSESRPVKYEILDGASFTLETDHGISHSSDHLASSFLVDTNASFRYFQAVSNGGVHSLYMDGEFKVNAGGSVYMQAGYSDSSALIHFSDSNNASFDVRSPKSFVLYKQSSAPAIWSGTNVRSFTFTGIEQLNHWITARDFPQAGTFSDGPEHYWHNTDWAAFTMDGYVTSQGNTAEAHDLPGSHMPSDNFQFLSAKVISAGGITITPDPITDDGRPISGVTEPGAALEVHFSVDGVPYDFIGLTADEDGRFEIDPMVQIPAGTAVQIRVNTPFLIKEILPAAVPAGSVTITYAPEGIVFKPPPISTDPILLRRLDYDEPVDVTDTRPYQYQTQWRLLASISGPLRAASGEVLENAVVFKDAGGTLWDLGEAPVTVYTGGPSEEPTSVEWGEDEGILVRITSSIRSGAEYTTQLGWAIEIIDDEP